MCYLHLVFSIIKVLDVIVKTIEALVCYVGDIYVFVLVLIG